MDLNDLRIGVMLVSFVLFVGIMVWTWSAKRRSGFDEAARLPFLDDERAAANNGEQR